MTDSTSDASEMTVTDGGHFGHHVVLRGQFAVKMKADVADGSDRLNLVRTDLDWAI